ncbi:MAG: hypothetical protein J1E07_00530 [Treponema sp.]|nr:hypothetical protein [Treponema sp.]
MVYGEIFNEIQVAIAMPKNLLMILTAMLPAYSQFPKFSLEYHNTKKGNCPAQ